MPSAKAYFSNAMFLYWKRIQEFSRGTENLLKNSGKLSAEYHRFLPAGCITYRVTLSSASYVWGRGKPSTWLPRQKLAEVEQGANNLENKKSEKSEREPDEREEKFKGKIYELQNNL